MNYNGPKLPHNRHKQILCKPDWISFAVRLFAFCVVKRTNREPDENIFNYFHSCSSSSMQDTTERSFDDEYWNDWQEWPLVVGPSIYVLRMLLPCFILISRLLTLNFFCRLLKYMVFVQTRLSSFLITDFSLFSVAFICIRVRLGKDESKRNFDE